MKFKLDKKGYNTLEVENYLRNMAIEYNRVLEAQRTRIDMLKEELAISEAKLLEYKEKTTLITKAIYSAVSKAQEIEDLAKEKYAIEIERLKAFHEKWESYYYSILEAYPLDNDLISAGAFNQKLRKILQDGSVGSIDINEDSIAKIPSDLEETFENETKRLENQKIGYISIKTDKKKVGAEDDKITLLKMVPGADPDSPIINGDPVARIKQYLQKAVALERENKNKNKSKNAQDKKRAQNDIASTTSSSGFCFDEALNPTDDLETIMRDLGLL